MTEFSENTCHSLVPRGLFFLPTHITCATPQQGVMLYTSRQIIFCKIIIVRQHFQLPEFVFLASLRRMLRHPGRRTRSAARALVQPRKGWRPRALQRHPDRLDRLARRQARRRSRGVQDRLGDPIDRFAWQSGISGSRRQLSPSSSWNLVRVVSSLNHF